MSIIAFPAIVDVGAFGIAPDAAAHGIGHVALMPGVEASVEGVAVHALAAATRDSENRDLGEMGLAKAKGARAVATGGTAVPDAELMLQILRYAAALDLPVIADCWDASLAGKAVASDGETASRLGLASAPPEAEAIGIARDITLARIAGARLHIRQVTTTAGIDLIRAAKTRGEPVTCGITPAHLWLSDLAIGDFNPAMRLMPPLRSDRERQACLAAIADGTIDILCSGYRPRDIENMALPFADAPVGGTPQTALLPLALNLVRDGHCSIERLAALLAHNPARLLGITEVTTLRLDSESPWRLLSDPTSPFSGLPVQGRFTGI